MILQQLVLAAGVEGRNIVSTAHNTITPWLGKTPRFEGKADASKTKSTTQILSSGAQAGLNPKPLMYSGVVAARSSTRMRKSEDC